MSATSKAISKLDDGMLSKPMDHPGPQQTWVTAGDRLAVTEFQVTPCYCPVLLALGEANRATPPLPHAQAQAREMKARQTTSCKWIAAPEGEVVVCLMPFLASSPLNISLAQIQLLHSCMVLALCCVSAAVLHYRSITMHLLLQG